MSKAMARTRRHRRTAPKPPSSSLMMFDLIKRRLATPDPRSHVEFLADMRTKQAAGQLANPATAALLNRLERVIR